MINKIIKNSILAFILMAIPAAALASNALKISPIGYQYHDPAVATGSSISIPYEITNEGRKPFKNVFATFLPIGASATRCSNLEGNGGRCQITITFPNRMTQKARVLRTRFLVCGQTQLLFTCSWVDGVNKIDINVVNANTFLAVTDIHLKDGDTSDITYGKDTGDKLWNSTLSNISNLITEQSPKFMVLLGDLPAHRDRPNLNKNITAVLKGVSELQTIRNTSLPVFFVFGNNDSLAVNYGPMAENTEAPINLFSLDPNNNWPTLNTNPDCNNAPRSACTYPKDMVYAESRGYYSAYPLGSAVPLRFIALNSVMFSCEYYVSGDAQLAAAQAEMDWFAEQLADASVKGEAVYIGMHIPIGSDAFNHGEDMWNDKIKLRNGMTLRANFLALAEQYKDTIRVVMSGHTHYNELRALYADTALSRLSVLDLGVPGITPNHYNNPAMQVYLYDVKHHLVDQKTYYTTPTPKEWLSYSFINDYGCNRNTTLLQCANRVLTNLPADKYKMNFPTRAPGYDPSSVTSWETILQAVKITP